MSAYVNVELNVEAMGDKIYAMVIVENIGKKPVYIDSRYLPEGVAFISDQLHVVCNGKEVKFSGYRYNTDAEYYTIQPGHKKTGGRINIVQDYRIPSGVQQCAFYLKPWVAINPEILKKEHGDVEIYEFKSNVVNLELNNPKYEEFFLKNHKEILYAEKNALK
ncbi:hypothetical protein [Enterobacter sp. ENT03]|uniref:hypothetical protein n=1 Tax=Enterobacter sp. ENT03 TaxID=2854780 RepID=UPI001C467030|nr:hypothetical protein [Enterobacter sp. ENT03]MBV7407065.1 hypothetical protein [Enterobacter sp. ENT03]